MGTTASAGWPIGLALGIVVIAVAAVIVIVIVVLAMRIAKQAETAEEAVEVVRQQTAELGGIAQINDSGRADPARRAGAAEGGGRQMTLPLAVSDHTYWGIALAHRPRGGADRRGPAASLLMRSVRSIERSVDGLLEVAAKVAANTANIPQLEATAPVLALIVEEAVVQDGYMNALTDGFGGA